MGNCSCSQAPHQQRYSSPTTGSPLRTGSSISHGACKSLPLESPNSGTMMQDAASEASSSESYASAKASPLQPPYGKDGNSGKASTLFTAKSEPALYDEWQRSTGKLMQTIPVGFSMTDDDSDSEPRGMLVPKSRFNRLRPSLASVGSSPFNLTWQGRKRLDSIQSEGARTHLSVDSFQLIDEVESDSDDDSPYNSPKLTRARLPRGSVAPEFSPLSLVHAQPSGLNALSAYGTDDEDAIWL